MEGSGVVSHFSTSLDLLTTTCMFEGKSTELDQWYTSVRVQPCSFCKTVGSRLMAYYGPRILSLYLHTQQSSYLDDHFPIVQPF